MEFPQELLRVEWLKTVELMRKLSQESAGKSQSLRAERRNHSRQRTAVVNQVCSQIRVQKEIINIHRSWELLLDYFQDRKRK